MAGSVTVTREQLSDDHKVLVIKCHCVGDSSDGSVPATDIEASQIVTPDKDYWRMGYFLYEVWVKAGSPAPDAADVTITDTYGRQLHDEDDLVPATGTKEATITKTRAVIGKLTLTVANQATASAVYDVYMILQR